jgi:hypothetical protein
MASAPQCNLTQPIPVGNPASAKGFKVIPTGASLPQVIRILNENFQRLSPFNSFNFFGGNSSSPGAAGKPGKNAQEGNWTQKSIVTQKVRVYQMKTDGTINKQNYVDVLRVNNLTMQDHTTGATWVYTRQGVDGPNIQLLPS